MEIVRIARRSNYSTLVRESQGNYKLGVALAVLYWEEIITIFPLGKLWIHRAFCFPTKIINMYRDSQEEIEGSRSLLI